MPRTRPELSTVVRNWVRYAAREHASTCGSAERLYANDPERLRDMQVPIDSRTAERLDAMVGRLPVDERDAWYSAHGLRPPAVDKRAQAELSHRAHARLALWWETEKWS